MSISDVFRLMIDAFETVVNRTTELRGTCAGAFDDSSCLASPITLATRVQIDVVM